ncbi:hypothetical protein GCM10025734_00960 [Kitasatospora paranensis]
MAGDRSPRIAITDPTVHGSGHDSAGGLPAAAGRRPLPQRPAVSTPTLWQAAGVLMERYRLANGADTVDLIEAAARLHHLPPQVVAEAVIAAPRPADRHRLWFPRQNRPGAPDSSYWERSGADTTDRGTVLRVALARTVDISGCARADLQVLDPLHDTLVIEEQQGFDQPFLDFFARVSPATKSACSAARVRGRRVTVADTATDPLFSYAPTREALLAAGSRAVQSTLSSSSAAASGSCRRTTPAPDTPPAVSRRPPSTSWPATLRSG